MNLKETAQVMTILQVNYPDSFAGLSDAAMAARVKLWADILRDDDYNAVCAAVKAHIATDTNRFMPPVGVIKNALLKITYPDQMDEGQAWAMVKNALRNAGYSAAEEYEKLPPVIQRVIGSAGMLKEWACIDVADLETVTGSHFRRLYRARAMAEREYLAMPESVKSLLRQTAARKAIGGAE